MCGEMGLFTDRFLCWTAYEITCLHRSKNILVLKFSICNSVGGRFRDRERKREGGDRGRRRKRGELSGESESSNIL